MKKGMGVGDAGTETDTETDKHTDTRTQTLKRTHRHAHTHTHTETGTDAHLADEEAPRGNVPRGTIAIAKTIRPARRHATLVSKVIAWDCARL